MNRILKTMRFVVLGGLIVSLASCCSCRKQKSPQMNLTDTEWHLIQLYDEAVSSNAYRINFQPDGSVNGIGDCNRFFGTYTAVDGKLTFGTAMGTTRIYCPNQQREDHYFKMLSDADGYSIDGENLLLLREGSSLAIFVPAKPVVSDEGDAERM